MKRTTNLRYIGFVELNMCADIGLRLVQSKLMRGKIIRFFFSTKHE